MEECPYRCGSSYKRGKAMQLHKKSCQKGRKVLKESIRLRLLERHSAPLASSQTKDISVESSNSDSNIYPAPDQEVSDLRVNTQPDEQANASESPDIDGLPMSCSPPPISDSHPPQRPRRVRLKLPDGIKDTLPDRQLLQPASPVHDPPPSTAGGTLRIVFKTLSDKFGLFRRYYGKPIRIPDTQATLDDLLDDTLIEEGSEQAPGIEDAVAPSNTSATGIAKSWGPFPNYSAFRFSEWFWRRPNKSLQDRKELLDMFADEDFSTSDVLQVKDWGKMDAELDHKDATLGALSPGDGWIQDEVKIRIPLPQRGSQLPSYEETISGFFHRSITKAVRDVLSQSSAARQFHFEPFSQFWKSPLDPDSAEQRVYGELYTSEAFNRAHEEVQATPRDADDNLPHAIAALMFASDSTHLTSFGTAKLWPMYLFFGNQSKYERCRPSEHACHHIAYFPSIPDSLKDKIRQVSGMKKGPSAAIITHCRRELMHGALSILFDDEFVDAYINGMVIQCADGITRRIFLRIFTYSADYPEKVLLATIRDQGTCPCPRCLVSKESICGLGNLNDKITRITRQRVDDEDRQLTVLRAQQLIYNHRAAFSNKNVESLLFPQSLVPTQNAFSLKLSPFGFNFFPMLVVDLMHEFELGVWKSVFTHLTRILEACGNDLLQTLNERYRAVSPFGRDTIRRFYSDVSLMKKLAARDFEDILICSIPAFDGLLPEHHDRVILDLLFTMCRWLSLAKLRLHTDATLQALSATTAALGNGLRLFVSDVCSSYETLETAREAQARQRRAVSKGKSSTGGRHTRQFNLNTYKIHALGDYARTIGLLGTTDSYSTSIGELEHRQAKQSSQRINFICPEKDLAKLERRQHALRRISERENDNKELNDDLPYTAPDEHHFIAKDRRNHFDLLTFINDHRGDPATKFFYIRLMDFLFANLMGQHYEGDEHEITEQDRGRVIIKNNRIFKHNRARINYTTYDVRRAQDIINLGNGKPGSSAKRDILVLSNEDPLPDVIPHPFWYARVLGIFHCDVCDAATNSDYIRMEFLWVRWMGRELDAPAGWEAKRLDRIGFDIDEFYAYGFLNPSQVIRCAHLIPAFHQGRVHVDGKLQNDSLGSDDGGDWEYYYVNRFVDRDMMMRYSGGGIGHVTQLLPNDFTSSTVHVAGASESDSGPLHDLGPADFTCNSPLSNKKAIRHTQSMEISSIDLLDPADDPEAESLDNMLQDDASDFSDLSNIRMSDDEDESEEDVCSYRM
ncbi:hypothetical protein FRC03_012586 [Tulasnella sp. 419]|nr:hypothetical protein FRC03_012586 [Tulasnella sp. 419]